MDEAEYEEAVLADEDLDEPRSFTADAPDRIGDDAEQPDDYEAGEGEPAQGDAEEALADRIDRDVGHRPGGGRARNDS